MICPHCSTMHSIDLRALPLTEHPIALRRLLHELAADMMRPGSGVRLCDLVNALQSITMRVESVANGTITRQDFIEARDIERRERRR